MTLFLPVPIQVNKHSLSSQSSLFSDSRDLFSVVFGSGVPFIVNPLSPMSDQHQISPCNINAL